MGCLLYFIARMQSSSTSRVRFTVISHTSMHSRFYHTHVMYKRNWDGFCLVNLIYFAFSIFQTRNLLHCIDESWWNMTFKEMRRVPTDPRKQEKALNLKFCSRPWKSPQFWSWVVKINLWPGKLILRVLSHKWSSCVWNTSVSLLLIFAKFTNLPSFHQKFWTQRVPVSYQSKQRPELTDGHPSLFRTCAQSWNAAATKFDKHGNFEARQVL